jgi:cytochrome c oxidase subunit 4
MAEERHQAMGGHPTPLTYFKVAITLSAITAAEVAIFYVEEVGKGIIPILAVMSATKFALVAMFYMHLRYDARLFSGLFIGGLALAFAVVLAVLGLFKFFV